jgi:mono/diheme cytochrome c family protein
VLRPVLLLAFVLGCAGQIPPPTDADALRASARYPGTTVADLAHGRELYIEHCSHCHSLHRPTEQPASAWPKIVREMTKRAKLDGASTEELIRYLVVASEAPR